jgi:hypothetical protein
LQLGECNTTMANAHDVAARVGTSRADQHGAIPMQIAHAPGLDVRESDSGAVSCSSCPGTPRDYRVRHQQLFAARSRALLSDSLVSTASAGSPPLADQLDSSGTTYRDSSPSMPRMRGSSSLRAVSAARAIRMSEVAPLPGAAWPGHFQNSSTSQAQPSGVSSESPACLGGVCVAARRCASVGCQQVLPPRPPTSSENGSPRLRRPSGRSGVGLPSRPPIPTSGGHRMDRALSTCAQAIGRSSDLTLTRSVLCH